MKMFNDSSRERVAASALNHETSPQFRTFFSSLKQASLIAPRFSANELRREVAENVSQQLISSFPSVAINVVCFRLAPRAG